MSLDPHVLLLNPPHSRPVARDCWNSGFTRGRYHWQPLDLLVQSGRLRAAGMPFVVFDAVAERLGVRAVLERLRVRRPAVVFSLAGWCSWQEDRAFFTRLKEELPDTRLIVSGDIFRFEPAAFLQDCPAIDAACVDFLAADLGRHVARPGEAHPWFVERGDTSAGPWGASGTLSFPTPCHERWIDGLYRLPFPGCHPFGSVLTSVGCPYSCRYCVLGGIRYVTRPVESVLEEVRLLLRMGVRHVYFRDPTFNGDREHFRAILEGLIRLGAPVSWNAFVRAELFDDELLELARRAGAKLLQFGLESAGDYMNTEYERGMLIERVVHVVHRCHALGIQTAGHFIIGFPDQSGRAAEQDYHRLLRTPLRFATFSRYEIRPGTPEWERLKTETGCSAPELNRLHGGEYPPFLPPERLREIQELKTKLLRRFYLRPRIILDIAANIGSLGDALQLAANAVRVLQGARR